MNTYDFIGLDVSKDKFDVALDDRHRAVFSRDKKGFYQFFRWIQAHAKRPWVCMEATGCYSEAIADYLLSKDIQVSIANPMQIKSFCRAKLLRNKTDSLDARAIAQYASVMPLRPYQKRSQEQKELNDLNKLLDTLKTQLIQLTNQLESTQGEKAKKRLRQFIRELKKRIRAIETELDDFVNTNEQVSEHVALITSIPGVGKVTAYQLLGMITDINSFTNAKEFAAFIGLSPKQTQSGKLNGLTRISKVGNPRLRKAFYMASLSAKRHNPNLKDFVARLQAKGKAPKAILCAIMRKLAHFVFGVLKNKQAFITGYKMDCGGSASIPTMAQKIT